jgi:hypothetical protein
MTIDLDKRYAETLARMEQAENEYAAKMALLHAEHARRMRKLNIVAAWVFGFSIMCMVAAFGIKLFLVRP